MRRSPDARKRRFPLGMTNKGKRLYINCALRHLPLPAQSKDEFCFEFQIGKQRHRPAIRVDLRCRDERMLSNAVSV